ncbi:uncharacterized protein [Physcomitrium patens]|uniref:uncharacterized protein isoform X2 n=1 Tax=Physcomitrium patens TaxID=3218 RepID=UPI000D161272|nr:leucine-rich repeat extensin-like protein 6 isoform X2 [Physcomitrium patens]|eukprot:XP_024383064.1 leucine-rich repeat extensin-like protein 6 isoform X2 [Physcomitrella patens]
MGHGYFEPGSSQSEALIRDFCRQADPFFGNRTTGNHPPGHGGHPQGTGRHGYAWSKWRAYIALQCWKKAITEDPNNILASWNGKDVCSYKGVYCAPPPDPKYSYLTVVAAIDLNGAQLKGTLVPQLGELREIALFHLNSNRFYGGVPDSFRYMKLLTELDLSNNQLGGDFPKVVLAIPKLAFLDLRFNTFYGKLPSELFSKRTLQVIFVNNNNFEGTMPSNFAQSEVAALVLANNKFQGNIPKTINNMSNTLYEILALGNEFDGGIPDGIGNLKNLLLFDYSSNKINGGLPDSLQNLQALEIFNMSKNYMGGAVTAEICQLKNLSALALSDNYFNSLASACKQINQTVLNVTGNCLFADKIPDQKDKDTCARFYGWSPPPPPPSPPPPSPPPPSPPPPSPPPPSPPPPSPPPPPPCPYGYQPGKYSGTCFMLVTHCKTWEYAEHYCNQQSGGHLAAVADWDELKDVGELCAQSNVTVQGDSSDPKGLGCYVGGRRPCNLSPATNGWNYPGSPCIDVPSLWNMGEPNNYGGQEACLGVKYESDAQAYDNSYLPFMLNDLRCDIQLPFICTLTRCSDYGCGMSKTCKTLGDHNSTCSWDDSAAVGYKCQCSEGYFSDDSGTCSPK